MFDPILKEVLMLIEASLAIQKGLPKSEIEDHPLITGERK
jgi:hypothetical protein